MDDKGTTNYPLGLPISILGTPDSPCMIPPGEAATATLGVDPVSNCYKMGLTATVSIPETPPSTRPVVKFQTSLDGSTFFDDPEFEPMEVPITTPGETYSYPYLGQATSRAVRVVIANGGDGPIGVWVQGTRLAMGANHAHRPGKHAGDTPTFTRTITNLLGSPDSPQAIEPDASSTATLNIVAGS
jgi:hypothetical protein